MARSNSRCSRQYFSHAGKLFVTGVIGFPLTSLILLNFSIGYGFLLFDRFLQKPVLDVLSLHLPLMLVEISIERICSLLRLLTAFPVQFARVTHALAGSNCPSLHISSRFCNVSRFARHFGVGNGGFSIAMIGIDA
jgi:hypothetical protein